MVSQLNSVPREPRHSGISSSGSSMPSSKACNPPRPFNPHSSVAGTCNLEDLAAWLWQPGPSWMNQKTHNHLVATTMLQPLTASPAQAIVFCLHQMCGSQDWAVIVTPQPCILSSHGVIGALNYRFLAQQLQISKLCACIRVLVKQCRVIPFPYVQYPLETLVV